MTDTNRAALLLAPQTAWGEVAPNSIESKAVRMTGESLTYNISNTQSDEIRSDRNVSDLIRTDASVSGDINFELSYGGTKGLYEIAVFSEGNQVELPGITSPGDSVKGFLTESDVDAILTKMHTITGTEGKQL